MTFSASAVSVPAFFGAFFGVAGCGEMPNGTTMVAIVIRNAQVMLHGSSIGITCSTPTPSYTIETANEIASATMVIAAASA